MWLGVSHDECTQEVVAAVGANQCTLGVWVARLVECRVAIWALFKDRAGCPWLHISSVVACHNPGALRLRGEHYAATASSDMASSKPSVECSTFMCSWPLWSTTKHTACGRHPAVYPLSRSICTL